MGYGEQRGAGAGGETREKLERMERELEGARREAARSEISWQEVSARAMTARQVVKKKIKLLVKMSC